MTNVKDHILVVDDDPLNRMQLLQSLKQQGYSTDQADDGEQALLSLERNHYDLVLLDILMPVMDGFQVLGIMKTDSLLRDIPVVVISALDEMESVIKCIDMGAEDYLSKPFDPVLLKARVGACLEKKHMRETIVAQLGKYVPESVVASIIRDQGALEPKRATATIFFSDIENFTRISETMTSEEVFKMANEYFAAVVQPIVDHGGVVNQFQGDALLVTFNVPIENPMHTDNAVKAATIIQEIVAKKKFGGVTLRTRIGINTGEVMAGNVGSGSRQYYTVLGDAVNSAARLEQLNKKFGTDTIISGATVDSLKESYPLQPMGVTRIRGKREDIRIFALKTR